MLTQTLILKNFKLFFCLKNFLFEKHRHRRYSLKMHRYRYCCYFLCKISAPKSSLLLKYRVPSAALTVQCSLQIEGCVGDSRDHEIVFSLCQNNLTTAVEMLR